MSNEWSLSQLLGNMHSGVENSLASHRGVSHPGTKGATSEDTWLHFLQDYMPKRYCIASAHIVDSRGNFSRQIDAVVFDRQYTPFILRYKNSVFIPAESVYAIFEVKQKISLRNIRDAGDKIASVRQLCRTSLDIYHAGGKFSARPAECVPIYGGILTYDSGWKKPLEESPLRKNLLRHMQEVSECSRINFGCVATQGYFHFENDGSNYAIHSSDKATTAFLFKLIATLQVGGTVPRIDMDAYMKFL